MLVAWPLLTFGWLVGAFRFEPPSRRIFASGLDLQERELIADAVEEASGLRRQVTAVEGEQRCAYVEWFDDSEADWLAATTYQA